jgi:hypothetical protein
MKEKIINQFKQAYFTGQLEQTEQYFNNPELIKYLKSKQEPLHFLFLNENPLFIKLALDKLKWKKEEFETQFSFNNIYKMLIKQDNLDGFLILAKYYKNSPNHLEGVPLFVYTLNEKSLKISHYLFEQYSIKGLIDLNDNFDIFDKFSQTNLKEKFKHRVLEEKIEVSILTMLKLLNDNDNFDMDYLNQYLLGNANITHEYKHAMFTSFITHSKFHLLNQIDKQLVNESFHGLKLNHSIKEYKNHKQILELKKFIKDNPHVAQFSDSFFLYDKNDTNLFFHLFKKNTKKIGIEHKLDFIRKVLSEHFNDVNEMINLIEKCNKLRPKFIDDEVYKRLFTEHLVNTNNHENLIESVKLLKYYTDTLDKESKHQLMYAIFDKIFDLYPVKSNNQTNIKQRQFKEKILDLLMDIHPQLAISKSGYEQKPYMLSALKFNSTDLFQILLKHNPTLETPTLSKTKLLALLHKHSNPEFKIMYEKILLEENALTSELKDEVPRKKMKI